ncbi:hypothetical protein [Litoribrevibacter albus]|uniref:Uncharacterized protein n=1 Tax=Litoribrevibacter albus TaxID=1473156 RepID=A0AA37W4J1_9GAMM|nr:hypothetical protein [Litoribrevibacter albus]GLQ30192.1 hypothetical protein GCM10007876_06700 [Litoribrevibacter albus]
MLTYAVDLDFELDANAVDSNVAAMPDDWDHLTTPLTTGILSDPAPHTIFTTGGSKDIRDVSEWKHTEGSVPDKDDISNAYAAAYVVDGDLIVYFGADRFANNGDAQIGFWFFQNEVGTMNDGTFSGTHAIGDILVISDFSNGGDVSTIKVLEWVGDRNGDSDGDGRLDGPLQLVDQSNGHVDAGTVFCTDSDYACAVANVDETPSPWPYIPKFGTSGFFPQGSFFEGGVNITKLVGNEVCLSSYLAETRSSTSPSAQLKDFVLGSFNTCKISVEKSCPSGQYDPNTDTILYRVEGKVTNEGFGSVTNIYVEDDVNIISNDPADIVVISDYFATLGDGTCDFDTAASPNDALPPGESICFRHFFNSEVAMPTDEVTASATTLGGTAIDPATDQATCPDLGISAGIMVTPQCNTELVVDPMGTGKLVVQVEISGSVCNTSESPLSDVTVWGNQADVLYGDGSSTFLSGGSLAPMGAPGECLNLTSKYFYPDTLPGFPYVFGDMLTASGIASKFADPNATCQLNDNNDIECRDMQSTQACPLCPQD